MKKEKTNSKNDESIIFQEITNYYYQHLSTNADALNCLKGHGILNSRIVHQFKIGYVDGSLLNILSDEQKKLLSAKGLINKKGKEKYIGHFVIPLYTEYDIFNGYYFISSELTKQYFVDRFNNNSIFFNSKAIRVYDEIILTDNILDAFAFQVIGFPNAIYAHSPEFYSKELFDLLSQYRIKDIYIAVNQELNESEEFNQTLTNLKKKKINKYPLVCGDEPNWFEYLKKINNKQQVLSMINQCKTSFKYIEETQSETDEEKAFYKQNGDYFMQFDKVHYRISGVKNDFISSLRVTMKVTCLDNNFYDSVDLYSARGRSSLVNQLSYKLGLVKEEIEEQLLTIIDKLEDNRDKHLNSKQMTKSGKKEMTDDEKKTGMQFLMNPNLIEELKDDLTKIGLIAEDVNKVLLYMIATSRKTSITLAAYILGRSSGGKSWLTKCINQLIPAEDRLIITSASDQSLYYLGKELSNKFITLGEFEDADSIEYILRELLSEGKISRLITTKDQENGETKTRKVEAWGPVAFVSTSTNPSLNPENLSRCLILFADETEEQTKRIFEYQRNLRSMEGFKLKEQIRQIKEKHHIVQRLLENIAIFNPYEKYLDFPALFLKSRRSHLNFLNVIDMTTFLHQKQREIKFYEVDDRKMPYIESTLEDYKIAYDLMLNGILENTLDDIPKAAKDFHVLLEKLAEKIAKKEKRELESILITRLQMIEHTGWSVKQVRTYTRILLDYEYLELVNGFNRGQRHFYRVLKRSEVVKNQLKKIPTPEEIEKRMQEDKKKSA